MLILDPLQEQRIHADGLGLAFDRHEIDLDQFRIAETRSRLLADHQIDAINFAQAFQPGSKIHRIAEQRVIEMLLRAVIADAAFAGVDADAHADRPEDFPRRLRLLTTPAGQAHGTANTALVAPGVSYAGEGWQFGIEAMIPMTRATGKGLGVTAQFHVWLDYLFPNSIGRPVF